MKWLVIFGLVAGMAVPCDAAKRMTVAQLEQTLIGYGAAHKKDAEIARQLAGFELTERLTETSLGRLSTHVGAGSGAATALRLLADQSEFLEAPASEMPAAAIPDADAQKKMLEGARRYVSETLPRLPNFLATRAITFYDDSPQELNKGEWPTRAGLHLAGTASAQITIREEQDNQPASQGSALWQAKTGLISGGEFGSSLGMILTDTAKGEMTWSHWEKTATGMAAVFRYAVPESASHYEVMGSLQREARVEGYSAPSGGRRGVAGIATRPNVSSNNNTIVRARPAYHGSVWINPADGAVLRITMDADLKKDVPFRRAAILVQYGPVEIGGQTFICPVRSVAFSLGQVNAQVFTGDEPTEWLNETFFTGYHRFASTSRIVESAEAAPPESAPAAGSGSGCGSDCTRRDA